MLNTQDIQDDSIFEDNIIIRIDGITLKGFVTNSIERSMNSIADSFTFTATYNVDDNDSYLLDYDTFYQAELYISGNLFMTGVLEHWESNIDAGSRTITVRSKAGVTIDCPSLDLRCNYTKKTIKQIADVLLQPFGITLEIPYGDSGIINNAKREITDKIFNFLATLARQKGFILNSTAEGNIKLDRANITGRPILNLIQGESNIIDINSSFDGTQRFSSFKTISQTRGNANTFSEITDNSVSVNRPIIIRANNNEKGEIKNAATWERARSLRALSMTVKYDGWRDKNNDIILENNIVTLIAPDASIFDETRFLIEKVKYNQDNGRSVELSLVLPQAYSIDDYPEVMPWQR